MEKRLLFVFLLATALSLPIGLVSADNTEQTPVQEKIQTQDLKQVSESQPAKIGEEQEPAPIILRMTIIKAAD